MMELKGCLEVTNTVSQSVFVIQHECYLLFCRFFHVLALTHIAPPPPSLAFLLCLGGLGFVSRLLLSVWPFQTENALFQTKPYALLGSF